MDLVLVSNVTAENFVIGNRIRALLKSMYTYHIVGTTVVSNNMTRKKQVTKASARPVPTDSLIPFFSTSTTIGNTRNTLMKGDKL